MSVHIQSMESVAFPRDVCRKWYLGIHKPKLIKHFYLLPMGFKQVLVALGINWYVIRIFRKHDLQYKCMTLQVNCVYFKLTVLCNIANSKPNWLFHYKLNKTCFKQLSWLQ
jgi:hypothetical protein